MSALWKSGSAVEPSPIQALAMRVPPLIAEAIAQPTAWMYCVPRLPASEKKPCLRKECRIGICRPLIGSRELEKSWHIISTRLAPRATRMPCWR